MQAMRQSVHIAPIVAKRLLQRLEDVEGVRSDPRMPGSCRGRGKMKRLSLERFPLHHQRINAVLPR